MWHRGNRFRCVHLRYLRRAVSAMEVVYPPNYPELGDLYAALADAISFFVEKRGQTLLSKAKSQSMRYSAAHASGFFQC